MKFFLNQFFHDWLLVGLDSSDTILKQSSKNVNWENEAERTIIDNILGSRTSSHSQSKIKTENRKQIIEKKTDWDR